VHSGSVSLAGVGEFADTATGDRVLFLMVQKLESSSACFKLAIEGVPLHPQQCAQLTAFDRQVSCVARSRNVRDPRLWVVPLRSKPRDWSLAMSPSACVVALFGIVSVLMHVSPCPAGETVPPTAGLSSLSIGKASLWCMQSVDVVLQNCMRHKIFSLQCPVIECPV
jgi:hypothetical protein